MMSSSIMYTMVLQDEKYYMVSPFPQKILGTPYWKTKASEEFAKLL